MSKMTTRSHKKVLLMGKSGSGKTSMRAIIFKSQLAAGTRRLTATIDVESSSIKFLGGLKLDLWDCGGADMFMDSHLTSQSSTIFRSVHSLIYIFDVESPDLYASDIHYFLRCLVALKEQNPLSADNGAEKDGPTVSVLLHKMDLVPESTQAAKLDEFETEIRKRAIEAGWKGPLSFYGTSIWNETLYKAWSIVVSHLMPSLNDLRAHLSRFLRVTSAAEVVVFERTTFLVIASATTPGPDTDDWDSRRFERISTMVKTFKLGCSRIRAPFQSLTLTTTSYTAVLDLLTPETYILVLCRGSIQPAAIEFNIRSSRPHFAQLEAMKMGW